MARPTPLEVGSWMPPTLTPLLDCDAMIAVARSRVAAHEPGLDELAGRHLALLTPDRWAIEWHLPTWLGDRFGLDPSLVDGLTLANVLGLLSIRLEDDLEDGDVPAADVGDTRRLARAAFDAAIVEYRARFDDASPIWQFLDRSMAEWRAGAGGTVPAARGAPLKIAGYACCLAAGRLDLWSGVERSLDAALTALVLSDQFCDWEADLDAGRWNAFVARAVAGAPGVGFGGARPAVLAAMLATPVVRAHFDAAVRSADEAVAAATDLGIAGLAASMKTWSARTSAQGAEVASHYERAGDRAAGLLKGTMPEGVAT